MNCPSRGKIPITERPYEGSGEARRHVANTGSILDFVGDRVQGWDKSSSWVTRFGVVRIGFGATITFSWLLDTDVVETSGGVLRRGTPESGINLSKRITKRNALAERKLDGGHV